LLNQLISSNIDVLNEGKELLFTLGADRYVEACTPAFISTIGAHFRHVLEHYQCLLDQLSEQQVSYDKRSRAQALETNYEQALKAIDILIQQLECLSADQPLCVADMQVEHMVPSSLERELLFLQSHTTHHYAMIGAMSRLLGVTPNADFGVAIATRAKQTSMGKSQQTQQGAAICAQ